MRGQQFAKHRRTLRTTKSRICGVIVGDLPLAHMGLGKRVLQKIVSDQAKVP